MAERTYVPVKIPDWRKQVDTRSASEKAEDLDVMGYPLSPFLAHWTPAEIRGARAIAALNGYLWDCVGTDPRVTGRRFLDAARVAIAAAAEE